MQRLFLILICFSWLGNAYATRDNLSLSIRIDTAYVSNDQHIELEYSVLAIFDKVHLSVYTSTDARAARQNTNVPLTLSGIVGSYKKRIPVNLPQDQVVEILILLKGDGFMNSDDKVVKNVSPVHANNQINVSDLPAGNYVLVFGGYDSKNSFYFTKL